MANSQASTFIGGLFDSVANSSMSSFDYASQATRQIIEQEAKKSTDALAKKYVEGLTRDVIDLRTKAGVMTLDEQQPDLEQPPVSTPGNPNDGVTLPKEPETSKKPAPFLSATQTRWAIGGGLILTALLGYVALKPKKKRRA